MSESLSDNSIELSNIAEQGIRELEAMRKSKITKLLETSLDKIQEVLDDPHLDNSEKLYTAQTAVGTVTMIEKLELDKRKVTVIEQQLQLEQYRANMLPPGNYSFTQQNSLTINTLAPEKDSEDLLFRKQQQEKILNRIRETGE
jgi:hypothetical protein